MDQEHRPRIFYAIVHDVVLLWFILRRCQHLRLYMVEGMMNGEQSWIGTIRKEQVRGLIEVPSRRLFWGAKESH
jgi:hypothetical protein